MDNFPVFGTTLVGYIIRDGVLMGLDSLSSYGRVDPKGFLIRTGTQSYHYNKSYPIGHGILCSMFGNLTIAERLLKKLNDEFRKHLSYDSKIPLSIGKIVVMLRDYIVMNDGWELNENWVTFLVSGFENNKPCLWEVTGYKPTKLDFTSVGGDGLANGILSTGYDYEMAVPLAAEKVFMSIARASLEDEWTGGTSVKVFLVKGDGGIQLYAEAPIGVLRQRYFPDRYRYSN